MSVVYAFVPDDAEVVRISELAQVVGREGLRGAAKRYGVAPSTIWRQLRQGGYKSAGAVYERAGAETEAGR